MGGSGREREIADRGAGGEGLKSSPDAQGTLGLFFLGVDLLIYGIGRLD